MVSASANVGQNSAREVDGTNVEDTAMVPSPPQTVERSSISDPNTRECCDFTNTEGVHDAIRGTTTSHLVIIWQQSRLGGLSEGASQLLESLWRNKTK